MRRRVAPADDEGAWLSDAHEPCGDVRRGAEHLCLPASSLPDFAHDHGSGVDADAHRQANASLGLEPLVQGVELTQQREARAHSALGVVLMGPRVTEVDEQAVAQVLSDVPLVTRDRLGGGLLVGAHHVAQVLRVETFRQRRRAHEVAEHDRELTALSPGSRESCVILRPGGRFHASRSDPRKELALERRHLLHVYELAHELIECLVVEVELALQALERNTPVALQGDPRPFDRLEEAHARECTLDGAGGAKLIYERAL